jgi:hypothetical protein
MFGYKLVIAGAVILLLGFGVSGMEYIAKNTQSVDHAYDTNNNSTVEENTTPVVPEPTPTPTAATLTVNTNPQEASIAIDDKPISDTTPIVNMEITPGPHEIDVSKEGYKSIANKPFTVEEGEQEELHFSLQQKYTTVAPTESTEEPTNNDYSPEDIKEEEPKEEDMAVIVTTPQQRSGSLSVQLTNVVNKTLPEGKSITITGKMPYIEGFVNGKKVILIAVEDQYVY